MILSCNNCGYETEYDDDYDPEEDGWYQDDQGNWYCSDCNRTCDICGETYPSNQLNYSEPEDRDYCDGCREEYCLTCEHCHGIFHRDNQYRIRANGNIQTWCQRCYEKAMNEGRVIINDDGAEYITSGERADGHIVQINLHPEAWDEIRTCPDCIERRGKCPKCLRKEAQEIEAEETNLWVYDTRAMSYHHSEHHHFKETKYRETHEHPYLYYGMEFECLFNDRTPIDKITKEYIKATKGLFVAEFDRSVSDRGNGIEFISRPLSYKKWMSEEVYQLLIEGQKVLRKYHAYSPQPDACGIHVHMSLKFFEQNTKKKVNEIKSDIDWMFQVFQPEMEKISQRQYTRYCASKAYRLKEVMKQIRGGYGFNLNPTISLSKGNITQSMGSGDTHHDAIIQTNRTIEVRTFRSTIEVNEMLAIIEFCRAIAHAARNMKLNSKNTLGDILHCKDSRYLDPFLKKVKVNTEAKFANKLEVKI